MPQHDLDTPHNLAAHTRSIAADYHEQVGLPYETVEDKIVAALHWDINDRAGLKHEWRHIEKETMDELLEVWREIIRQEMRDAAA